MSSQAATYEFLGKLSEAHKSGRDLNVRGYDAGQINAMNYKWMPGNQSADAEISADNPLMRARARDLARNDAMGVAALDAWNRMVVGNGIQTFSDVRDGNNEPIDDLNEQADDFFEAWMEESDPVGQTHFFDQQRLAFSEVVEAGTAITLECEDSRKGRLSPLCFQVLEVDYLDRSKDRTRGIDRNEIHHGVEYDVYGRPAKYHLFDSHPSSLSSSFQNSDPRESERVIHSFWKNRPSQRIGVSWFHAVVKHIANMGGYLGSEISSARYASQFVAQINRDETYGTGSGQSDPTGQNEDRDGISYFDAGFPVVADLKIGESLGIVESSRPGSPHAAVWLKFMLGLMANGMRLSLQALTREATGSFSGNKATRLSDQEAVTAVYDWFVRSFVLPVRRRVIRRAFIEGVFAKWVSPREFRRNERIWLKDDFPEPKLAWLDPNKEVQAQLAGIGGGIDDYSTPWGRKGLHWRTGMRRLKKQQEYAAKIGLELPTSSETSSMANSLEDDEPKFVMVECEIVNEATGEVLEVAA